MHLTASVAILCCFYVFWCIYQPFVRVCDIVNELKKLEFYKSCLTIRSASVHLTHTMFKAFDGISCRFVLFLHISGNFTAFLRVSDVINKTEKLEF